MNNCPLCDRPMVPGPSVDKHHLIPKSYKGKVSEDVHLICHRKIHSVLSEYELFHGCNTWDKLRDHPDIATFIKWLAKKDPEYVDTHKDTKHRKAIRKRR